jgi:hypothetical protein
VVGVALDQPTGEHDGAVESGDGMAHVYFVCEPSHGLLVSPDVITLSDLTPTPVPPTDIEGFNVNDIGRRCNVDKYGPGIVRSVTPPSLVCSRSSSLLW